MNSLFLKYKSWFLTVFIALAWQLSKITVSSSMLFLSYE